MDSPVTMPTAWMELMSNLTPETLREILPDLQNSLQKPMSPSRDMVSQFDEENQSKKQAEREGWETRESPKEPGVRITDADIAKGQGESEMEQDIHSVGISRHVTRTLKDGTIVIGKQGVTFAGFIPPHGRTQKPASPPKEKSTGARPPGPGPSPGPPPPSVLSLSSELPSLCSSHDESESHYSSGDDEPLVTKLLSTRGELNDPAVTASRRGTGVQHLTTAAAKRIGSDGASNDSWRRKQSPSKKRKSSAERRVE
ncbi:hypothetical protein F5X98DRAFT_337109 [Xylaria grammica]|nr:hypothetical protein F5X98DRAFT_337109 [Xylaria grammica]